MTDKEFEEDAMNVSKAFMHTKSSEAGELLNQTPNAKDVFAQIGNLNEEGIKQLMENPQVMNQMVLANLEVCIKQLEWVKEVLAKKKE